MNQRPPAANPRLRIDFHQFADLNAVHTAVGATLRRDIAGAITKLSPPAPVFAVEVVDPRGLRGFTDQRRSTKR